MGVSRALRRSMPGRSTCTAAHAGAGPGADLGTDAGAEAEAEAGVPPAPATITCAPMEPRTAIHAT